MPKIGFEIQLNGKRLTKPQSFLNEAKLTQLALSVRFGATLAHFQESPLKLLVLDDLLISLDMNNRMKVVDIILGETFADYQKVILTHDIGFFKEFRRRIGGAHADWSFQRFVSSPRNGISLVTAKSELQKAEDYLHGQNLDEAATCLRKAADDTAARLREFCSGVKLPAGEFQSLTENLRAAKNKMLEKMPSNFYKLIIENTPTAILNQIVPMDNADLTGTPAEVGIAQSKRNKLRNLLTNVEWQEFKNIRVIDQVLETTERVLNPGSHGGDAPLYEEEIRNALNLIQTLGKIPQ